MSTFTRTEEPADARTSEPPPPDDDGANERVGMIVAGRYKLLRVLGVGGMGAVYEAEHQQLGKRVALKTLHPEYARDKSIIERFHREARAATAIGNEHIVDVTDLGVLPDGAPFLVMEMLKGRSLADLLRSEGPLKIARAVRIARQICDALAAVHEKGIVHRDLKPENIFLIRLGADPDFVKVLDFGISKMQQQGEDRGLTQTGMALGTPSYMSPEQAQGSKSVDGRTDVWALGVILYEMLAGVRPFDADSYPMLLVSIVTEDPQPLSMYRKDVPRVLDDLVLRCLEKPVETRVPSMQVLSEALAKFEDMDIEPDLVTREMRALAQQALRAGSDEKTRAPRRLSTQPTRAERTPKSEPATRELVPVRAAEAEAAQAGEPEPPSVAPPAAPPPAAEPSAAAGSERDIETLVPTAPVARPANGPSRLIAAGVAAAALLAVGIGFAVYGGSSNASSGSGNATGNGPSGAPQPAEPPRVAAPPVETPPAPAEASAAAAPAERSVPSEVRIRIRATPADARILIGGVEFPNPMDAPRPRSLDPIVVRIEREGYEPIERPLIFDDDRSFDFELSRSTSRGRPARGSSASSGERSSGSTGATPAAEPAGGQRGGFRDEF